jgi:hypothetical protein
MEPMIPESLGNLEHHRWIKVIENAYYPTIFVQVVLDEKKRSQMYNETNRRESYLRVSVDLHYILCSQTHDPNAANRATTKFNKNPMVLGLLLILPKSNW